MFYLKICFFVRLLVWIIHVYTANEQFAGTDTNVYIRLFNSKDESTDEYQLTHANWLPQSHEIPIRNLFEMGAHERFSIRTEDIGSVAKIKVSFNSVSCFHFLFRNDIFEKKIHCDKNGDMYANIFNRRTRRFKELFSSSSCDNDVI